MLIVAGIELSIVVADSLEGKPAVAGFVENPVGGSPEGKLAVAVLVGDNPGYHDTGAG